MNETLVHAQRMDDARRFVRSVFHGTFKARISEEKIEEVARKVVDSLPPLHGEQG